MGELPTWIEHLYTLSMIRGRRITRLEETNCGHFDLDAAKSWELGTNNIGVFAGGYPPFFKAIEQIQRLQAADLSTTVILVAESKQLAADIMQFCFNDDPTKKIAVSSMRLPKRLDSLILCTPESLKRIDQAAFREIAAIVLLDPPCHVHKARCMEDDSYAMRNDRPQHIADFRGALLRDGWSPPLILLTETHAKALPTDRIAQAYCLDAWWFLDGNGVRLGFKTREHANPL